MNHIRFPMMALLTAGALLSGCASQKVADWENIQQSAAADASSGSESTAQALQRAQASIDLGKNEKLAFYAPRHLQLAEEQLSEARSLHVSGDPDGEARLAAVAARKTIKAGLETRKTVLKVLSPSLDHLKVLKQIRADEYYPEQFTLISAQIPELISLLEDNKRAEAVAGQKILLSEMHATEVETISFIHLQPVKALLETIREDGGEEIAPVSWATAQQSLDKAQALISATPRADQKIRTAAAQAMRAAEHAGVITAFSNEIAEADQATAEEIALNVERWLYRVSTALKHEDIRHRPFDEQSSVMAAEVETIIRAQR